MNSAQCDNLENLRPIQQFEHPTWTQLPAFRGVTECSITRDFLDALEGCPGIWTNILSQKQNRKDNPGWEVIRSRCNVKDVNETRKFYESIKKDMIRRVDKAKKDKIISKDQLEMDRLRGLNGLDRLRESQSNYKYWDTAEFLAKYVILKRCNYDLNTMPAPTNQVIQDIKAEIPENQHEDPDAPSAQSATIEVDEENSCLIDIDATEVYPMAFDLQSVKQEEQPIDVSQVQAGPSTPENLEMSSSANAGNATTLIDIKHDDDFDDDADNDSTHTQVRLIMSGIECSNESGNLPTSLEEQDVDMDDEDMEMEESREEMSRSRAEDKERAYNIFMERIGALPTEEMTLRYAFEFGIFAREISALVSKGLGQEEIDHKLKTFEF